jgi:hypothetical protein
MIAKSVALVVFFLSIFTACAQSVPASAANRRSARSVRQRATIRRSSARL